MALRFFFCAVIALLIAACGGGSSKSYVSTPVSDARLVEIEDRIVSVFENSTTVVQYAFIGNINDGRGYTAGRAGFTSGTGDMLMVVEEYTRLVPTNPLSPFLPALRAINAPDSVIGLDGIVQAWKSAATDARFITAQDTINELLYRQPARQLATALGATLPLTKLAIYEAGIQHGFAVEYDSVRMIVDRASAAAGGTPKTGISEKVWLQAFLTERRKDLLNPGNKANAAGWAPTVSRADAIQSLYTKDNFNLDLAISLTVYGATFVI